MKTLQDSSNITLFVEESESPADVVSRAMDLSAANAAMTVKVYQQGTLLYSVSAH